MMRFMKGMNLSFFPSVKKAPDEIQVLIQDAREHNKDGVFHIMYGDNDDESCLFLKRGEIIAIYSVSDHSMEHIPLSEWETRVSFKGDGTVKFMPLTPPGILIYKLLLQNKNGTLDSLKGPGEIEHALELQGQISDSSLMRLEWNNSLGAVLYLDSLETRYSLFLSSEDCQEEIGIHASILNSVYTGCNITLFNADPSMDAWQEILLRSVFAHITEHTLSWLQTVAGRSVVESFARLFNALASRNGLKIEVVSSKVIDNEFFASPQMAADAYRLLLTEMFKRLAGITGVNLIAVTLKKLEDELSPKERDILTSFSLLTKGYIYEQKP